MDLRSGHPFWPLKNGLLETYPALTADERCRVAVVGAGVTGALVASRLAEGGLDVVVLDKRDAATGSTAASTSLLQHEIDTELVELTERVGEAHAVRAYRAGLEAVDWIEAKVRELGDPCGFARRNSLYLASRERDVKRLEAEYACRARHGFEVEYLDAAGVRGRYPFEAPAAILSGGDAEIDAFRFTHALLRQARGRGVRVYDRTAVAEVAPAGGGFRLDTDRGPAVAADRVVFATGYESEEWLKGSGGKLHSTFAAVSEPMAPFPEWPGRCLVWESARPYFYFRGTPDDRVIIGGEDVPFATAHRQDRLVAEKVGRLVGRFGEMFPGSRFEVAFAWAGTFAESDDGLPTIGRPPERPHTYFALGYGGNGITMGVVAAGVIADDLLGRPSPDAEVFRFGR